MDRAIMYFSDESDNSVIQANGNYGAAEKRFVLAPAGDNLIVVNKLVLKISDANASPSKFGDVDLSGGTGVKFVLEKKKGEKAPWTIKDLFQKPDGSGTVFKSLQDLFTFASVEPLNDTGTSTTVSTTYVFDFSANPIHVYGRQHQRLSYTLNDDLTGLAEHVLFAEGEIYNYA